MKIRDALWLLLLAPLTVQADIYKSVDADGHVTYSSTPSKGSKRLDIGPASRAAPAESAPRRRNADSAAESFPRVDRATQQNRDDVRRKILQEELATEQKLLVEARSNLKDGEENPEVFRGKDGKTYRNVAKYDAKIRDLTEEIELHQRNIEALQTELSRIN
jgi:hypothetical protein